jgi:hypothetical protein
MRKPTVCLLALIVLGLGSYTIYAGNGRQVRVFTVPEGTVVELEEEAIDSPPSHLPIDPKVTVVTEIETIEVPEGIITIKTESIRPLITASDAEQPGTRIASETVQEARERVGQIIIRVRQARHALEHDEPLEDR